MLRTIGNQNFVNDSDKAPDLTFIIKTTHPNDLNNVLFDVPECK